ncbi:MAG: hypothetical protein ACYDH6_19955 [Acidimicrobiales bacterium]
MLLGVTDAGCMVATVYCAASLEKMVSAGPVIVTNPAAGPPAKAPAALVVNLIVYVTGVVPAVAGLAVAVTAVTLLALAGLAEPPTTASADPSRAAMPAMLRVNRPLR